MNTNTTFTAGIAVIVQDERWGETGLYTSPDAAFDAAIEAFGDCEGLAKCMTLTARIATAEDGDLIVLDEDGNVSRFTAEGAWVKLLYGGGRDEAANLAAIAALFGDK